jgi:hypothetical protein
MSNKRILRPGDKIKSEEVPENEWRFYEIEGEDWAVCKQNGRLRFFKLEPIQYGMLPLPDSS